MERFEGIAWNVKEAPSCGRDSFRQQIQEVRDRLDAAQVSALNLDAAWGQLRAENLVVGVQTFRESEIESWWEAISSATSRTPACDLVLDVYRRTSERMRAAESVLRPWVIRHLKERTFNGVFRRERLPGRAILSDSVNGEDRGIDIEERRCCLFAGSEGHGLQAGSTARICRGAGVQL
ncbi:MAG: hypothetical protein IPM55_16355 [Acidobacteria bacterium]|nr:hypothetical protein [Acidobacteriota bacterium]